MITTSSIDPELSQDEVHLWTVPLDCAPSRVGDLRQTLSKDEEERADRFYFQKGRDQFVVCRAWLRIILGRYLRVPPPELEFRYNSYGKPSLENESEGEPLLFNLSHSDDLALLAVSKRRDIGIDIERIRDNVAFEQIADRYFTVREMETIREAPESKRAQIFFSLWTCKESYIKAKGMGLSIPLDRFEVTLGEGDLANLALKEDPEEAARWSLQRFTPRDDYVGAITVQGHGWRLKRLSNQLLSSG